MKATDILSLEHRLIERVLSALETGAWLFSLDDSFRTGFFLEAAEFIRGFADCIHHRKEEDVLFKTLVENGTEQDGRAIEALLQEHELARGYAQRVLVAAEAVAAGDGTARSEVVYNARRYAALMRHHIEVEEKAIFPLVANLIPPAQQAAILYIDENVDEGVGNDHYKKYVILVHKLEQELEM